MARLITSGVRGGPVLGKLAVGLNILKSVEANANVEVTPDGTGQMVVNSPLALPAQNEVRLQDADSSNYVALKGPATVASNVTLTFPNSVTNGYFLQTDTNGNLSWSASKLDVSDTSTSTATHNVMITTANSGTITGSVTDSTGFTYVPSTGTLSAANFSGALNGNITSSSATITGGSINGTSVGATTASTGRFTSITETSSITLKENVNPIENALNAITQLAGVIYDRKDGTSKNEAGLIAEDVNSVLPNLVNKDENGNPESVQYTKLSAYLIEAVKTLKKEVDALKEK